MKKQKNSKTTYKYIPEIISATDLQRKAGKIINMVKESSTPYFVVRNNKPEMVMISTEKYDRMRKIQEEWELKDALEAIRIYKKEKAEGKLRELKGSSIYDLWKELHKND